MTRLPAEDTAVCFTPHKSLTVCKHKHVGEQSTPGFARMSLYVKICNFFLQTTFDSTHFTPAPTQLFVHGGVMVKLIV